MNPENKIDIAIFLMAIVIYLMRISGFYLAGKISFSSRLKVWLDYLPGCILVALIAPDLIASPTSHWLAALLLILLMYKTGQIFLSVLIGSSFVAIYPYIHL